MKEVALADYVPLWVTIREEGVTALVTPSADYVGALEIGTLDTRFAGEGEQEGTGEALRSFMSGVDEGTTLHFVYRVERRMDAVIEEYRSLCSQAEDANLREYVIGTCRASRSCRPTCSRAPSPGGTRRG
jgi:hypothetical protein